MKPSIPKGVRDFSPLEVRRRNFLFSKIRTVFQRYGFEPIETPAMENLSTLMGKYGEEGDRLIFKILNSGNFITDVSLPIASEENEVRKFASAISEKALRYDLTVPFARYVVQHRNELTFPFKRYQIQPVWRADRPQSGRYREFYQCDVDVIGSNSLLNEVELMHLAIDVFQSLDLNVQIKINNRKILTGIAEAIGEQEHIIAITVALDKFDKIGIDGVNQELRQKNISEAAIQKLQPIITTQGNNAEQLNALRLFLVNSEIGKIGIQEIETVLQAVGSEQLIVDITLARGLNYYTGAIFEVKALNATLSSSISGGGRYDNLTGIFGLENMSGVGISFGVDRIYDVMLEQQKFKHLEKASDSTQVVLTHFGENEQRYCMTLAKRLRKAGINTEVYPDLTKKITKQFEYANKKQVPYVIVIGDEEIRNGLLTVKNMETGTQERMTLEQLITSLKQSN